MFGGLLLAPTQRCLHAALDPIAMLQRVTPNEPGAARKDSIKLQQALESLPQATCSMAACATPHAAVVLLVSCQTTVADTDIHMSQLVFLPGNLWSFRMLTLPLRSIDLRIGTAWDLPWGSQCSPWTPRPGSHRPGVMLAAALGP